MDFATKRNKLERLSNASTAPTALPASATSGSDLEPISSSCRINSRPSNGRRAAARITWLAKIPRSPNHSRKPLTGLQREVNADRISDVSCGASSPTKREVTLVLSVIAVAQLLELATWSVPGDVKRSPRLNSVCGHP